MSLELLNDYYVPGPVLNILPTHLILIMSYEIGSFPIAQIKETEATYITCMSNVVHGRIEHLFRH